MFVHNRATTCRGTSGRLIALLALLGSLGACTASSSFREHLYPKLPPGPAAINADYNSFNEALGRISKDPNGSAPTSDVAVQAYVTAGYDLAEKTCLEFFIRVRQLRNDTRFTKDAMRNAMASAGLISALATVPTSVLAGLFGATGAAPAIVDDFERTFLFADASDSLYPLIFSAMHKFRDDFPVDKPDKVNALNADLRVRQHATLCSLPYLTYVVKTAVKEVKIVPAAGATPAAGAKAVPGAKVAAEVTPVPETRSSAIPLDIMEIK